MKTKFNLIYLTTVVSLSFFSCAMASQQEKTVYTMTPYYVQTLTNTMSLKDCQKMMAAHVIKSLNNQIVADKNGVIKGDNATISDIMTTRISSRKTDNSSYVRPSNHQPIWVGSVIADIQSKNKTISTPLYTIGFKTSSDGSGQLKQDDIHDMVMVNKYCFAIYDAVISTEPVSN